MVKPTPSQLRALVKMLRELGVTRYSGGGVEIELGPAPAVAVAEPGAVGAETDDEEEEPTPEEMLMWSTSNGIASEKRNGKKAD